MASMIFNYAPNRQTAVDTTNSTSFLLLASDGSTYSSVALLLAAGKTPFPGLDPGMFAQSVTVENVTAANAIAVAWNTASTPTGDTSTLVPGGSQFTFPGQVWNVWLQKSTGTDHVVATVLY